MATATISSTQIPELVGPWFLSPFFERMLAERDLDSGQEELVRSYAERGYTILDDLGIEDFDAHADRIHADVEPLHEGGKYNRIMDGWTVSDPVRALATSPRILETLELLYGRRPIPFQTLNFWRGSQQSTHTDSYHFHSRPKHFMCGVWVALEDVDEANGPVHYYPGSHRLPDYDSFGPGNEERVHEFVGELISTYGLEKESAHLKRGQGLVWSANLLHGGDPVTEEGRTRLSQVTHYYFDDCAYYTPMRSDPVAGKIYFRQIVDVGTGRLQPLSADGHRIRPSLRSRASTLRRRLQRRLGKGYLRYVT